MGTMSTISVIRAPTLKFTVVESRDCLLALECIRQEERKLKLKKNNVKGKNITTADKNLLRISTVDDSIIFSTTSTSKNILEAWDLASVRHSTFLLSRGDVFFMPAGALHL